MENKRNVYECINLVMADLAKEGIAKDKKNNTQGYNFRGIDDVYSALSRILSTHKLLMLPRMVSRESTDRPTKSGGVQVYTIVCAEFDLVSAEDGSKTTIRTYGEASDTGDKSTNKAMSAAYKYAAFQAFCIPVEGDDADATTVEFKNTDKEQYIRAHWQELPQEFRDVVKSQALGIQRAIEICEINEWDGERLRSWAIEHKELYGEGAK